VVPKARNGRFAIVSVFLSEWKEVLRFALRPKSSVSMPTGQRPPQSLYGHLDVPQRVGHGDRAIRLISLVSCIYYRSPS